MTKEDRVYIIDTKRLPKMRCIQVDDSTASRIAEHMLGRIVNFQLICRPGYVSIFLESSTYEKMRDEARRWLNGE
jgi:hypothetical protein